MRRFLIALLLVINSTLSFATTYNYPSAGGGTLAVAPQSIREDDEMNINSGTFAATGGSDTHTVNVTFWDPAGNNADIYIDAGATLTYSGGDSTASTIITENLDYGVDVFINGTLSNGNGRYAVYAATVDAPAGGGVDIFLQGTGSIIGDLYGELDLSVNDGPNSMTGNYTATDNHTFSVAPSRVTIFTMDGEISTDGTLVVRTGGRATFLGNITSANLTVAGYATFDAGITSITATNMDIGGEATLLFSDADNYATISSITNLTGAGTVAVGRTGTSYIPANTYTLMTFTTDGSTIATPTSVPPTTTYTSWSANKNATSITVTVNRTGFNTIATTPAAKSAGLLLETLGASSARAPYQSLLNYFEAITDANTLNQELEKFFPDFYAPIPTVEIGRKVTETAALRLARVRNNYVAGNKKTEHGVWIRGIGNVAEQKQKPDISGYDLTSSGIVIGFDKEIDFRTTIGIAGSISQARTKLKANKNSTTDIASYLAMLYGTYELDNKLFLDWILAVGANRYDQIRHLTAGTFRAAALAKYSGQQYAFKGIVSKEMIFREIFQFTPQAMAQFSYLRQFAYEERNAGVFNMRVSPNNQSVLQVGLGAKIGLPMQGKFKSPKAEEWIAVPEAHVMISMDAKGGEQVTNSNFIDNGTLIKTTSKPSKFIIRTGGSLTFDLSERFELIANYDFEMRKKYQNHSGYLNLRYKF